MYIPVDKQCKIVLGDERMEVVREFEYLETLLSKHGEMEEVRERTVKRRTAVGSLAKVMKRRNVSMEVKRGLRNNVLLPALMYGSDMEVE